ncbi:MAG: hypothetical protein RR441_11915 [Longicatena sp.]
MSNFNEVFEKIKQRSNMPMLLIDAFTDEFVSSHSKFTSAKEFFSDSILNIKAQSDYDDVPDELIERYVSENTDFKTWNEMLKSAVVPIIQKRVHGDMCVPDTSHTDEFDNIIINPHVVLE